MEYESNKNIDFFNNQVKEIHKKPFNKLAFLGITIGLTLSLGVFLSNFGLKYYDSNLEQTKAEVAHQHQLDLILKTKAVEEGKINLAIKSKDEALTLDKDLTFYSAKIKKISPNEFNNFIDYLKQHLYLYDSRTSFLSESVIKAQEQNRRYSIDGSETSKFLHENLITYKKGYESIISKTMNIYDNVLENHLKESKISTSDLTNFINLYQNYQNGIVIRNIELEKTLNNVLFVKNQGNLEYNTKSSVRTTEESLEKQAEDKIIKKLKP